MGIGDELMCAGEARKRAAGDRTKRYGMLDKFDRPKAHFIWDHCDFVAPAGAPNDGNIGYVNGMRPYIAGKEPNRWVWREYEPYPAALRIPEHLKKLRAFAEGMIVFNPGIKAKASPNKDWGRARWRSLISRSERRGWLQLCEPGAERITGATHYVTGSFYEALALLSGARAAVLHEGALHHAAASLDVPAVVLYGGYISPRVTGYNGQKSLFVHSEQYPLGCGHRLPCEHCARAMAQISPDDVLRALDELLAERRAHA